MCVCAISSLGAWGSVNGCLDCCALPICSGVHSLPPAACQLSSACPGKCAASASSRCNYSSPVTAGGPSTLMCQLPSCLFTPAPQLLKVLSEDTARQEQYGSIVSIVRAIPVSCIRIKIPSTARPNHHSFLLAIAQQCCPCFTVGTERQKAASLCHKPSLTLPPFPPLVATTAFLPGRHGGAAAGAAHCQARHHSQGAQKGQPRAHVGRRCSRRRRCGGAQHAGEHQ